MTFPHLRMPNDVVEALARLRLNGTQWQVLWAIFRKTLCWQKAGAWGNRPSPISNSEIADATCLDERQIKRELATLLLWNIVIREKTTGRGHKPATYFNLDFTDWHCPKSRKGAESATLSAEEQRVIDPPPFDSQNSDISATLSPGQNGGELVTVSPTKNDRSVTLSRADSSPFSRGNDTLSETKPSVGKKQQRNIKKQRNKETEKEAEPPAWIDKESWSGYLEMRRAKNKSPTNRAMLLVIKSLSEFRELGQDPNEILNRSTVNNWTGVFPLQGGSNGARFPAHQISSTRRTTNEQRRAGIPAHLSDVSDLPEV